MRLGLVLFNVVVFTTICEFIDARSSFEKRCKELSELKNGEIRLFQRQQLSRRQSIYIISIACEEGYISNVAGLEYTVFECAYTRTTETVITARDNYVDNHVLDIRNVTCKEKKSCGMPPIPSEGMEVVSHGRNYQKDNEYTDTTTSQKTIYTALSQFEGDQIEYKCKTGYSQVKEPTEHDELYDYYYELYGQTEEDTLTSVLTCDRFGEWTSPGSGQLNFGQCEEIKCDASSFFNISNGNITNYKDTYSYMETMELICEPGFRPINGMRSVTCLQPDSFNSSDLPEFGCEAITCMEPPKPIYGRLDYGGRRLVNETVTFSCEWGTTLRGKKVWTCKENGEWDSNCVICEKKGSHCQAPCIPMGAIVFNPPRREIYKGDQIELNCDKKKFGGSEIRTCMRDKRWSGLDLDCIGNSKKTVATEITVALKNLNRESNKPVPDENNAISSRIIRINNAYGVHLYLAVDVSRSITEDRFNTSKEFIKALLPKLSIHGGTTGTRLELYFFGSRSYKPSQTYTNAAKAEHDINDLKLDEIRNATKGGTDIQKVMDDIMINVQTLHAKRSQNVMILISDGQFTQGGSPNGIVDDLKKDYSMEVYAMFVGDPRKDIVGYDVMQSLASPPNPNGTDQHFFSIPERDIATVVNEIVQDGSDGRCGYSPNTGVETNSTAKGRQAKKLAWPWMVQFYNNTLSLCGGSLINNEWILTAAHCFKEKGSDTGVDRVVVKKFYREYNKDEEYQSIHQKSSYKVIPHERFNSNQGDDKRHLYDIALVKLSSPVKFDQHARPVCLWNETTANTTGYNYKDVLKPGSYGTVTGWGFRCLNKSDNNCKPLPGLKQISMKIQDYKNCKTEGFDNETMFCAGGIDDDEVVDSCTGDSGGPFVYALPIDPRRYYQLGIVSYGEGCKQKGQHGVYTKLTENLLNWIKKTTETN